MQPIALTPVSLRDWLTMHVVAAVHRDRPVLLTPVGTFLALAGVIAASVPLALAAAVPLLAATVLNWTHDRACAPRWLRHEER